MRSRRKRDHRTFLIERLEVRSLLSGGPNVFGPLPAGSLNPAFGKGGIVSASPIAGPTDTSASDVAIGRQGDGKIVVAGTARGVESQSGFALARYNSDGTLDTHFGNNGTVFTPFLAGTVAATASALAIEPDGKILVVGTVEGTINGNDSEEFALARYNADGSLDTRFGNGGEVLTDFGPDSFSSASSVAIAGNGAIVVAGSATIDGTNDFAVARYNTNGSLDKSFGTGGEATPNFGPNLTVFATKVGLTLQPNGKVVLAGTVADFTGGFTADFGLARLNADGSPDTTFGNGGEVTTGFGALRVESVAGVGLEPGTGAIVVAGTVQDPSNGFTEEFALARYNARDGSLDAGFGTGGEVVTAPAPSTTSVATDLAIQPNGAILVTGTTSGFDSSSTFFQSLTLNRYTTGGSLDATFGTNGQVLTAFAAGSRSSGAGVAVQPDGKIVAAGSVTFTDGGTVAGFGVARYNTNGSLDRGFGTRGEVVTNVPGPSSDVAAGEAIQRDGKIVVVGTASVFAPNGAIDTDFALTRFNADGTVDTHFGNNGSVLTDFGTGTNQAVAVAIQPDGRIVVAGTINGTILDDFQDIGVARYNPDGTLDRSFGNGGEVLIDLGSDTDGAAAGLAIQPNGKIVVAGTASGFDADDNFFEEIALARLNANGRLDATFGTGGEVLTSFGANLTVAASGVALQSNGQIVVAGTATDQDTFVNEFALARYNANGKLDAGFGTGGEVVTSFGDDVSATARAVAIQANGRIVVAGSITDPDTFNDDFALARYNTNGKLDTTFGTAGLVTTSFGPTASADGTSLAIQPDGEIVVAGTVEDFSSFTQGFGVARYNPDGSLDPSFGTGGEVVTSFGPNVSGNAAGVAIAPDGDIVVAGTTSDNFQSEFTLADYLGSSKKGRGRG